MNYATKFFIILSLFYHLSQNVESNFNCKKVLRSVGPQQRTINNLQTNHITLIRDTPRVKNNYYQYNFKQKHSNVEKRIALTILYFAEYRNPKNVDYFISSIPLNDRSFTVLLAVNLETSWTLAHAHVLISSKTQVFAGSFNIEHPNLLRTDGLPLYEFIASSSISFPLIIATAPHRVSVFISGIRSQSIGFTLKISLQTYVPSLRVISIKVSLRDSKTPIERLQVTYTGFSFLSGIKTVQRPMQLPNSLRYEEQNQDQDPQMDRSLTYNFHDESSIVGMLQVTPALLGSMVRKGGRLLKEVIDDQKVIQNIYKSIQPQHIRRFRRTFDIIELDIATTASLPVNSINPTDSPCLSLDQCKQSDGIIIQDEKGEEFCKICPNNTQYNSDTKQCECRQGFTKLSNVCISADQYCGQESVVVNNTCYFKNPSKSSSGPRDIQQILKKNKQTQTRKLTGAQLIESYKKFPGIVIGTNLNESLRYSNPNPDPTLDTNPDQDQDQDPDPSPIPTPTPTSTSTPTPTPTPAPAPSPPTTFPTTNKVNQNTGSNQQKNKSVSDLSKNSSQQKKQRPRLPKFFNLSAPFSGIITFNSSSLYIPARPPLLSLSTPPSPPSTPSMPPTQPTPPTPPIKTPQIQPPLIKPVQKKVEQQFQQRIQRVSKKVVCTQNQIINQKMNICQCIKGYQRIGTKCEVNRCLQKEIWDENEQKCKCRGLMVKDLCTQCSNYSFIDPKTQKCVCKDNYQGDGIICKRSLKKITSRSGGAQN